MWIRHQKCAGINWTRNGSDWIILNKRTRKWRIRWFERRKKKHKNIKHQKSKEKKKTITQIQNNHENINEIHYMKIRKKNKIHKISKATKYSEKSSHEKDLRTNRPFHLLLYIRFDHFCITDRGKCEYKRTTHVSYKFRLYICELLEWMRTSVVTHILIECSVNLENVFLPKNCFQLSQHWQHCHQPAEINSHIVTNFHNFNFCA